MANYYVKSGGSDSNNGTTWALAKLTIWGTSGAMSVASAGDTIYCGSGGSESNATDKTLSGPGTATNPVRIICTSDTTNNPPNSGSEAQYWTLTQTGQDILLQDTIYAYGLKLDATAGGAASSVNIRNASDPTSWLMQKCWVGGNDPMFALNNSSVPWVVELVDSTIKFGSTDSNLAPGAGGTLILRNCTLDTTTVPTSLVNLTSVANHDGGRIVIDGTDLSGVTGTLITDSFGANNGSIFDVLIRRCKIASGVTVHGITEPYVGGAIIRLHSCSVNEATNDYLENLRFYESFSNLGSVIEDTSAYLNAQAPDQSSGGWSAKMTTSANATQSRPYKWEIPGKWITDLSSAKTITVEITHSAGAALKDDEVWVEVYYPDNDTATGLVISDRKGASSSQLFGAPLTTAADQATSTESWTGAGTYKQKLVVTTGGSGATQGKEGPITVVVVLAKASTTIYVDPAITVT